MVTLKSNKAEGSFLGMGTHVWLEVIDSEGVKTTFSGSKIGNLLGVKRDYNRDYDRDSRRGKFLVPAPEGVTEIEWDRAVINAGDEILKLFHLKLSFRGFFPCGKKTGNCCTIAREIVELAGGAMPRRMLRGYAPGLLWDCW